jgi:hypothetical protein
MSELRTYYVSRIRILVILIVAYALAVELVPGRLERTEIPAWTFWIAGHLNSGPVVGILFLLGEWLIRNKLWRVERPGLVFEGDWNATTTYEDAEKGPGIVPMQLPHTAADHIVRFTQSCLHIGVAPSAADPFVAWHSVAADLASDDTKISVRYAYVVTYAQEMRLRGFPPEAIGYEAITAVESEGNGRPKKLAGTFAHCARGQYPVYRGTVTLTRVVRTSPASPATKGASIAASEAPAQTAKRTAI